MAYRNQRDGKGWIFIDEIQINYDASSLRFRYFFYCTAVLMVNLFWSTSKNSLGLKLTQIIWFCSAMREIDVGQSTPLSEVEISVPWGQFSGTSNAEANGKLFLPTQTSNTPLIYKFAVKDVA